MTSTRIFRSCTSRWRWCTSREGISIGQSPCCARGRSCRIVRPIGQRYPAKGLHWLLGLVRLASGDTREALVEFEREIASGTWQPRPRFAMNAYDGAGFAHLDAKEPGAAVEAFNKALELFPEHARSLVGLGAALKAAGDTPGADAAFNRATAAIEALRRGGRASEAMLAGAMHAAVCDDGDRVVDSLNALLDRPDMPFSGWTIPIEPLLAIPKRCRLSAGRRAACRSRTLSLFFEQEIRRSGGV